ncbi:MAG: diaminopimelate decarboxylase family protein [Bacillota bacterium]
MSIISKIPTYLLTKEPDINSPSIIYDYETIRETVLKLRNDLSVIPGAELCFSIKANRNPMILNILSELKVGADVASLHELEGALNSGMSPVFATSPSFSVEELEYLYSYNIIPDFNSFSQLKQYVEKSNFSSHKIGMRIRLPFELSQGNNQISFGRNSRFGIDILTEEIWEIIEDNQLTTVQLHLHLGEMKSSEVMEKVMKFLELNINKFPDLEIINLGGGITYLYSNADEVKKTWALVGESIRRINASLQKKIRVVIEPGMLLLAMSGYLYATVRSSDVMNGKRAVTLDSSAWNLTYWSYPQVVHSYTLNQEEEIHDIYGNTCYEHDVFVKNSKHAILISGDRLLLTPVGAYVTSMARNLHGFPLPEEWILRNDMLIKAGSDYGITHI